MPNRAAYFDVDGTLTRSNIVGPLIYMRKRLMDTPLREMWLATLPPRGLYWWLLDKVSRGASNRAIYASYGGMDAEKIKALAQACHDEFWRPRMFPKGRAKAQELARNGFQLVLVTGSIDFLLEPLAQELGARLIAPGLKIENGAFTGELIGPALTGSQKADAVKKHAQTHQIALQDSYSFGDAIGDLPMLECVGHPIAVNPGRRLRDVAAKRNWPIENWTLI